MTRQALKENPSKIFSIINAICRLTNTGVAIQTRSLLATRETDKSPPSLPSEERAGERRPEPNRT
jgi:hypothetical protein